jgi:hypothetical protein
MVIATEFNHRENKEGYPDGERDPNSELSRGHLNIKAVRINVVGLRVEMK